MYYSSRSIKRDAKYCQKKISKFSNLEINIQKGDMIKFMEGIPNESIDIVVCGWAICYTNPTIFMREVNRVLKPNGKVGIIETRSDSEQLLMRAFEEVLCENPSYLKKYIKIELPSNDKVIEKWFLKEKFHQVYVWEGEEVLPCENASDAIEWILRSGAASGFLDVLDSLRQREILTHIEKKMDVLLKEDTNNKLSHTYVAGIAKKIVF